MKTCPACRREFDGPELVYCRRCARVLPQAAMANLGAAINALPIFREMHRLLIWLAKHPRFLYGGLALYAIAFILALTLS